MDTVVVTGQRGSISKSALESSAPIDVLYAENLDHTGNAELGEALSKLVPSVDFGTTMVGVVSIVRPVTNRSLGPAYTLVLLNGKRRHNGSLIINGGGDTSGGNPVDLDMLPTSGLSKVEILKDSAAIPGVGPITSLTFVSAIDQTERFSSSRDVGPLFGLTPRKYQSGETDYTGRISKTGDVAVRTALYEAANTIMIRASKAIRLKAWATAIAMRSGMKKAKVALARKLGVIMHAMLRNGQVFSSSQTEGATMA